MEKAPYCFLWLKKQTGFNRKNIKNISRIDYGSTIFYGMPDYLRNCLQKIQNAAASFVTGRYNHTKDVLKLNWLPVHERLGFSIAKLTFKIMNNKNSPSYLKLNRYQPPRNLRSNQSRENTLSSNEDGTFQAMATKVFNKLPETVRGELCNAKFIVSAKSFFLEEAKKRLQVIWSDTCLIFNFDFQHFQFSISRHHSNLLYIFNAFFVLHYIFNFTFYLLFFLKVEVLTCTLDLVFFWLSRLFSS